MINRKALQRDSKQAEAGWDVTLERWEANEGRSTFQRRGSGRASVCEESSTPAPAGLRRRRKSLGCCNSWKLVCMCVCGGGGIPEKESPRGESPESGNKPLQSLAESWTALWRVSLEGTQGKASHGQAEKTKQHTSAAFRAGTGDAGFRLQVQPQQRCKVRTLAVPRDITRPCLPINITAWTQGITQTYSENPKINTPQVSGDLTAIQLPAKTKLSNLQMKRESRASKTYQPQCPTWFLHTIKKSLDMRHMETETRRESSKRKKKKIRPADDKDVISKKKLKL